MRVFTVFNYLLMGWYGMQEKIRMTLLIKFIGYTYTFWSEFEYTRHGNYNLFPRFAPMTSIASQARYPQLRE